MDFIRLFNAELRYAFILHKRYMFDLLAGVMNILLFLVFIQLGIHSFQGNISADLLDNRLSVLIIGFFTFMIISNGISAMAKEIADGSKAGTLEQTLLCPLGPISVFLAKIMTDSVINLLIALIIVPISMLICRRWFSINLLKLFVLIIPLWLSCWGVGYILATLTLIFKKVQSFINLIQYIILVLLILPSYPFNAFSLIPIAPEAMTINKIFASGISVPYLWIVYLYVHGFICLVVGMMIFKTGGHYAKVKGILGQY